MVFDVDMFSKLFEEIYLRYLDKIEFILIFKSI